MHRTTVITEPPYSVPVIFWTHQLRNYPFSKTGLESHKECVQIACWVPDAGRASATVAPVHAIPEAAQEALRVLVFGGERLIHQDPPLRRC